MLAMFSALHFCSKYEIKCTGDSDVNNVTLSDARAPSHDYCLMANLLAVVVVCVCAFNSKKFEERE